MALPIELNRTEQIELVVRYVEENFISKGMCADICIHDKQDGNPHTHIMLTTRSLDDKGKWMGKQRKNYILDKNGDKIYDPAKRQYKCGRSIKANDWDNAGNITRWRENWARECNREFERKGIEKRVTHESYAIQGIEREASKHLGKRAKELERRGIQTCRSIENHKIMERNRQHELQRQRKKDRRRIRDRGR